MPLWIRVCNHGCIHTLRARTGRVWSRKSHPKGIRELSRSERGHAAPLSLRRTCQSCTRDQNIPHSVQAPNDAFTICALS